MPFSLDCQISPFARLILRRRTIAPFHFALQQRHENFVAGAKSYPKPNLETPITGNSGNHWLNLQT
jgi:hypothetical protein